MKPDGMLIEPDYIVQARQAIAATGSPQVLEEIGDTEPALAAYVAECLACVCGKLALSGAPTPLVQAIYEETLALVLTCVQAQRRGHFELWKDTMTGTRLAQLDESLQPPAKPRRKKRRGAGPET
jgi:hypothetical protein